MLTRYGLNNADPAFYRARMDLFKRYYLTSLASQTEKNFTVLLRVDDKFPEESRRELEKVLSRYDLNVQITQNWKATMGAGMHITTRMDNDDAIARDFISRVQAAAKPGHMVNFVDGIIEHGGRHYTWSASSNMFLSLVHDEFDAYCQSHTQMVKWFPCISIAVPGRRFWIHVQNDLTITHKKGRDKTFYMPSIPLDRDEFTIKLPAARPKKKQ